MLKKLMGGNEMTRLFEDWELKDDKNAKNKWIELKDVRRAHKEKREKK